MTKVMKRPALVKKNQTADDKIQDTGNDTAEIKAAVAEVMGAFSEMHDTLQKELDEIKKTGVADPLTKEKIDKLAEAQTKHEARVNELRALATRPAIGGSDPKADEAKAALVHYMKTGSTEKLAALDTKALSAGSNPDGGFMVPDSVAARVRDVVTNISPVRSVASVEQAITDSYTILTDVGGEEAQWVGEASTRNETNTPTLTEIKVPMNEISAKPKVTAYLIDWSRFDVEDWLSRKVSLQFAQKEGAAFVSGDGVAKPKGFLAETPVANASYSWGNIGYIATGADGAFLTTASGDQFANLVDLQFSLDSAYFGNANFMMSQATLAEVRKIRDADGNPLVMPGVDQGLRPSMLGHGIVMANDMPAIASDSYSIAFGDWREGYTVIDGPGIRVLRDPFSSKPHVMFYTTAQVGGHVSNYEAIKLLKFGTS